MSDMISSAFSAYQIPLSPQQRDLFEKFLALFIEYNSHTNLSAIRDPEGIVLKHFVDSAMLIKCMQVAGSLLDIGTGGGFPGIPLKILVPGLDMLLVDSVGKKVKATEHFCRELGLDGIGSVQARTETLAEESPLQSAFDIVTARAVAYLPEVLPWCAPFVKKGGTIALYKLDNPDEVRDGGTIAKRLGLRLASKYPYELGGQKRAILMYEKM